MDKIALNSPSTTAATLAGRMPPSPRDGDYFSRLHHVDREGRDDVGAQAHRRVVVADALIGLVISILRLSIAPRPAAATASAMSEVFHGNRTGDPRGPP